MYIGSSIQFIGNNATHCYESRLVHEFNSTGIQDSAVALGLGSCAQFLNFWIVAVLVPDSQHVS